MGDVRRRNAKLREAHVSDDFEHTQAKLGQTLLALADKLKIESFPGAAEVPEDVRALRAVRQVLNSLPREVAVPDAEGWWAVGTGGPVVNWFYVTTFDDGTPPSIWVRGIEDFVPIVKKPLKRWWGPFQVPSEE